jgi:hypothetical protein
MGPIGCRLRLKCDGARAETRFRLSAKRTRLFKSAGGRQFSRLQAAEVCALAVVMLDTLCSKIVWRVLATHYIRQFPLQFSFRASRCDITSQLDSTKTSVNDCQPALRNVSWNPCWRNCTRPKPSVPWPSFTSCKRSLNVTCKSAFRQNYRTFLAESSTFRRWELSCGDARGDAWWRNLERLTQIA